MPELPDLVYIEKKLRPEVLNRGSGAKVRDHLEVRNRSGDPCPACGTTIRRTGVLGYDSFFCPKCQPEIKTCMVPWDNVS